jgi:hypothetical protein
MFPWIEFSREKDSIFGRTLGGKHERRQGFGALCPGCSSRFSRLFDMNRMNQKFQFHAQLLLAAPNFIREKSGLVKPYPLENSADQIEKINLF